MDEKSLWKTVLAELQLTLTPGSYQTLFSKSSLLVLKDNVATIALANVQIKNMAEERYYALLKEILDRITKNNNSLVFEVLKERAITKKEDLGPLFEERTETDEDSDLIYTIQKLKLRPDFTFENFAVSGSNQLAYAAALAVTKNPGNAYNPLYVWGGVGVGKTHLVHAIAHALILKARKTNIVYCSGEEFTNEITMAIRNKSTDKFKNKFRSAQALVIDDIQFIAGKDTTQEEFFHTFNAVQREGGQVILTSDQPPHEITGLEDRIRSRFESGLVVDIQAPDLELRTAILMIKTKQKGIELTMGLSQKAAQKLTGARQIEGFIARVLGEVQMNGAEINEALVDKILDIKSSPNGNTKKTDAKKVITAVCSYYNIKISDLRGSRRKREVVRPRQILMWLLRESSGLTLKEVGTVLGGRDHTTIMHGVETVTRLMENSELIKNDVVGIRARLV